MKEQLVSFETAKLAKEKGFDIYVLTHYSQEDCFGDEYHWFDDDVKNSELEHFEYSAPTQSLLQKWLRDIYNIHIVTTRETGINNPTQLYFVSIITKKVNSKPIVCISKNTFEDALEIGLNESLKLITNESTSNRNT